MYKSLALLEFNPITDAYLTIDKLLKTFSVILVRHNKICPGSFLSILSGNTEDIIQIVHYCRENKIRCQSILNISHEIIKYISRINLGECESFGESNPQSQAKSEIVNIAIFESKHCIHAVKAADIMLKTSDVNIVKLDFSLGLYGKGFLIVSGKLSELESAIDRAKHEIPANEIAKTAVIANVATELLDRRFL